MGSKEARATYEAFKLHSPPPHVDFDKLPYRSKLLMQKMADAAIQESRK